jgi:hypothetical protein
MFLVPVFLYTQPNFTVLFHCTANKYTDLEHKAFYQRCSSLHAPYIYLEDYTQKPLYNIIPKTYKKYLNLLKKYV